VSAIQNAVATHNSRLPQRLPRKTVLLPYIGSCLVINFRFWLTPATAGSATNFRRWLYYRS